MAYSETDPIVRAAIANGDWLVGCGGTETPFTDRMGRRVLYVWQPATGRHAYLNLDTDMIIPDAELAQ